jgi:hypothetical protein
MRIAEDLPDRLTLEARPWILGSFLATVLFAMLAVALYNLRSDPWLALGMLLAAGLVGLCFAVFVRRVLVIFDRAAGAVVIRTRSVLGQTERSLPISDIREVTVETSVSHTRSNGRRSVSRTHRPVLQTLAGPVPLTEVYSGGNGATEIAEAANRWLRSPQA